MILGGLRLNDRATSNRELREVGLRLWIVLRKGLSEFTPGAYSERYKLVYIERYTLRSYDG